MISEMERRLLSRRAMLSIFLSCSCNLYLFPFALAIATRIPAANRMLHLSLDIKQIGRLNFSMKFESAVISLQWWSMSISFTNWSVKVHSNSVFPETELAYQHLLTGWVIEWKTTESNSRHWILCFLCNALTPLLLSTWHLFTSHHGNCNVCVSVCEVHLMISLPLVIVTQGTLRWF